MPQSREDNEKEAASILVEMEAVANALNRDHLVLIEYVSARKDREFWQRTAIRNFFADTEARVFQYRRFCLALHSLNLAQFTPEEVVCLKDQVPRIDNGKVEIVAAKTKTADNFLFSVRMICRVSGLPNPIDTGREVGWAKLKNTIKIRDRLTHPKTSSDLQLTASEESDVIDAVAWVEEKFETVNNGAKARWVIGDGE